MLAKLTRCKKLFCVLAMLLVGCGQDDSGGSPIGSISFFEAKTAPYQVVNELSGRISAYHVAEVRPQVGGIILERLFTEGSHVKAGQVLYQIDPALFEAAVNSAKADLLRAESAARSARLLFQRYSQLIKVNAISRQEYDDAKSVSDQAMAQAAAAKAALQTAQINLNYTKVTAPVDGVIGKSAVTAGALVAPNQPEPLATVQTVDPMYVDVMQSSTDLLRLKRLVQDGKLQLVNQRGLQISMTLPDGTPYPEEGELLFSDVTVEPATGMYVTRATFPNADGLLMPNLFVRLKITEAESPSVVFIPQKTVVWRQDGIPFVRVLVPYEFSKEDPRPKQLPEGVPVWRAVERPIELGRVENNEWVVLNGISEGDKIALDGFYPFIPKYVGSLFVRDVATGKYVEAQQPTPEPKK